jgi:co-chaperonin GroES (HSP10)
MPEASDARERPLEGIVLDVGRGRLTDDGIIIALECETGDVVQFGKYAGIYVFDASIGQDVLLMREDEALGRKFSYEVEVVKHPSYELDHVPGDPRCPQCRAGLRVEVA